MLYSYLISAAFSLSAVVAHQPRQINDVTNVIGAVGAKVGVLSNTGHDNVFGRSKKMLKAKRDLYSTVKLGELSVSVNALVSEAIDALNPVLADIDATLVDIVGKTEDDVFGALIGPFTVVEDILAGLSGNLAGLGGVALKEKRDVVSSQQVATTLASLLQSVANAVNLVESTTGSLKLQPIFFLINGDLSNILSTVGNLLIGVLSLVQDLLAGVLGTVVGLPIIGQLLGGLLGGVLGGL